MVALPSAQTTTRSQEAARNWTRDGVTWECVIRSSIQTVTHTSIGDTLAQRPTNRSYLYCAITTPTVVLRHAARPKCLFAIHHNHNAMVAADSASSQTPRDHRQLKITSRCLPLMLNLVVTSQHPAVRRYYSRKMAFDASAARTNRNLQALIPVFILRSYIAATYGYNSMSHYGAIPSSK